MVDLEQNVDAGDLCGARILHQDRIEQARRGAPSREELERLGEIFKAMGDPTRLTMLTGLMQGEMCVCDLSAYAGCSESAASHQLRRLRDLGLVKRRREGKVLYYSLDDDHVRHILDISLQHLRH